MKKQCAILLVMVLLLLSVTACGSETPIPKPSDPTNPTAAQPTEPTVTEPVATEPTATEPAPTQTEPTDPGEELVTGVLYVDRRYGADAPDMLLEYPFEYTGERKTAEELAVMLSELTGLNFSISAAMGQSGVTVDWKPDSALIAGHDGNQKEEFFCFSADQLNWLMLDSLYMTLKDHMGIEKVYYTMDGGKELEIGELYPINNFPLDEPYMGSVHYFYQDSLITPEDFYFYWGYADGKVLHITETVWYLYNADQALLDSGPVQIEEHEIWLMNEDGSSGGGKLWFNEHGGFTDGDEILTQYTDFPAAVG